MACIPLEGEEGSDVLPGIEGANERSGGEDDDLRALGGDQHHLHAGEEHRE